MVTLGSHHCGVVTCFAIHVRLCLLGLLFVGYVWCVVQYGDWIPVEGAVEALHLGGCVCGTCGVTGAVEEIPLRIEPWVDVTA